MEIKYIFDRRGICLLENVDNLCRCYYDEVSGRWVPDTYNVPIDIYIHGVKSGINDLIEIPDWKKYLDKYILDLLDETMQDYYLASQYIHLAWDDVVVP